MWRVECDGIPPSLNKYYSSPHWRVRKKMTDEWREAFGWAIKASNLPRPLPFPISLSVTEFCKRKRDADNAIIAAKYFLDALVELEYLKDDDWDHVRHVACCTRKATDKKERSVFIIKEMNKE